MSLASYSAGPEESTIYTESQLNEMTKAELEVLASDLGIEGVSTSQTKAVMIETILANL